MRQLILAIMIILLPLRGWVGDAMATGMASGSAPAISHQIASATEIIATHDDVARAAGHFDGEAATQSAHDCADHDAGSPGGHCNSCTVCQACHTVALSPPTADSAPLLNPLALPHSPVALFASADPVSGQKPPIS